MSLPAAKPAPMQITVLVSLTVTATCVVFTEARCRRCRRILYQVPGEPLPDVRELGSIEDASGRGRVVQCARCRVLYEVIEHERAS